MDFTTFKDPALHNLACITKRIPHANDVSSTHDVMTQHVHSFQFEIYLLNRKDVFSHFCTKTHFIIREVAGLRQ